MIPAPAGAPPPDPLGRVRLVFVMDFIYGLTGGTENQVVKLISNLPRERYEISLAVLRGTEWLERNGGTVSCALRTFDIGRLRRPRSLAQFFSLVRHLRSIRPDIVVTVFTMSNIIGVLAARLAGARVVLGTRRDYGVWFGCAFRGDRHFLRLANRLTDGIVTNSRKVGELVAELEGYDPAGIEVIYNGIEARNLASGAASGERLKADQGIPEGRRVVGIVGGLRAMKHHETFIRAAGLILQRRKDVSFIIVGDGPLRKELEAAAVAHGLEGHVHFLGWREDVAAQLSIFDVGVNCSANEGLSNAVMEYMAAGVPAVVSDAGGNPELVTDGVNGLVFPLDDAEGLAARVLELLEDGGRRESLAAASRARIRERFSLEGMISAYDDYFTRLIAEARKE